MNRLFYILLLVSFTFFVGAKGIVYAQPILAQTWVSGTIKDSNGNPVAGGGAGDNVTVTCNGNVHVVPFDTTGSYATSYEQTVCKVGDPASASVAIAEGSGSNTGTVQNSAVNGPIVDLDVVVLDITVPEFGLIGGALTGVGSIAGYLYLKTRFIVK